MLDSPRSQNLKGGLVKSGRLGTSGPVGNLNKFDLLAFEFPAFELVRISDPVVPLDVLDPSRLRNEKRELLGTSDPVGDLTRPCPPALKRLVRDSAGGSGTAKAGAIPDLVTFGSLVSEGAALILPVLWLPMSITPCSRNGLGCQGEEKKSKGFDSLASEPVALVPPVL